MTSCQFFVEGKNVDADFVAESAKHDQNLNELQ